MSLTVEGDSILLNVPHRGEDFAYPIMVDPIQHIRNWWVDGASAGYEGWSFHQTGTTNYASSNTCPPAVLPADPCAGTGAGLYTSGVPGSHYPANSKGYWRWSVPGGGTSSIQSATLSSWRYRKGAASANNNPFAFFELTPGGSRTITTAGSGGSNLALTGTDNSTKYLQVGLTSDSNMTLPAGSANWRYNRVGAFTANLTDAEPPELTLGQAPSGWLGPNTPFTVPATARDAGLGMGSIQAYIGSNWTSKWLGWCWGTYPYPCPNGPFNTSLSFNSNSFPSGINTVPVKAVDVVGGTGHETLSSFAVRVDKAKPRVTLTGSLVEAASSGIPLVEASYPITIEADDRQDPATNAALYSNISAVSVFVDSVLVYSEQYDPCFSTTDCSTSDTYAFSPDNVYDGDHTVRVSVADRAGNRQEHTFSVTTDRNDNVIHARAFDGNPASGGILLAEEWKLVGLDHSRTESPEGIETRRVYRCPIAATPGGFCTETRSLWPDPENPLNTDTVKTRISPEVDDPRLGYAGELESPPEQSPTSTGNVELEIPSWLSLPPGHGSEYELYEGQTEFSVMEDSGPNRVVNVTSRNYFDSTTGLPLMQTVQDGIQTTARYYDYGPNLDRSSLPSDFFGPPIPSAASAGSEIVFWDETWDGVVVDSDTDSAYAPLFYGEEFERDGTLYCIKDQAETHYFEEDDISDPWVWNPALTGEENEELRPEVGAVEETAFVATYFESELNDCPTGPSAKFSEQPDLQITSMGADSAAAEEWRETYDEVTADVEWNDDLLPLPLDETAPVAREAVTIEDEAASAFLLPLDREEMSALVDTGEVILLVDAPLEFFLEDPQIPSIDNPYDLSDALQQIEER